MVGECGKWVLVLERVEFGLGGKWRGVSGKGDFEDYLPRRGK